MTPNERNQAPKRPGNKPTLASALSLEQAEQLEPLSVVDDLDPVIETFQLDEVLLPGEAAPRREREEVWDDAALPPSQASQMLGRFATNISVEQRRQQIRHMTSKAAPPAPVGPAAPLVIRRTLETVTDDTLADQLADFAERIAEKTPGEKLVKLAGEGAKQFILEQLNPALQITLGLSAAARHGHALREWGEMSPAERVVHVSGFAEGVAEVLSAVTPPPAGPAIKIFGLGLVLVKVAAERSTPVEACPVEPEIAAPPPPVLEAPTRPAGPPRGTRPLQRPSTGQLRLPQQPGTGPLEAPRRGTGPLKPPAPPAAPAGSKDVPSLGELWSNLKRFWF